MIVSAKQKSYDLLFIYILFYLHFALVEFCDSLTYMLLYGSFFKRNWIQFTNKLYSNSLEEIRLDLWQY